jgi:4-hydroxythreonine-4-phosphate dehydrogenase
MSARPLAVTCGDPSGVGPEIIAAWSAQHADTFGDIVVLGPAAWLASLPTAVATHAIGPTDYVATPGVPDAAGAAVAWAAMREAAVGCREGRYRGVVTGPVSKAQLAGVGFKFPGQTEFFASEWGGNPVMAFRGDRLRVSLVTWHTPLADVAAALSESALRRAIQAAHALAVADGLATPRIAVCGLNPHAGEGGLLGREEQELINPVVAEMRSEIPGLSFALPGDTVFHRCLRGDFDAVVAMYHDQGLAPLKTVDFDNAVNVTLGLPFVRTSPDHGTGFDIAGWGRASCMSLDRAIALARRLTK